MTDRPAYVYVILAAGGRRRTYVGWTYDPDTRLTAHNAGRGARSTRGRRWQLVYVERCEGRLEAMRREWRLKRDRRLRSVVGR